MSDKLEWLNQHIILFKHEKISEVVANEGYKVADEIEELANECNDSADEFLKALINAKKDKYACEFLARNIHKRAAIWWVYLCAIDIIKEQKLSFTGVFADDKKEEPEKKQEEDMPKWMQDIFKDDTDNITPQWVKDEVRKAGDGVEEKVQKAYNELLENFEKLKARQKELEAEVDPDILKLFKDTQEEIYQDIKAETGIYLPEYLKQLLDEIKNITPEDIAAEKAKESELMDKEMQNLTDKLDKMKKDIDEQMNFHFPKPNLQKQKKGLQKALDNIYAWIVSPDEINAKNAFESSKGIEDKPIGLLSMSVFWAFGNLNLGGDIYVKAPSELVGNGLNGALLQLSLEDGQKKPQERWKDFLNLGIQIAYGKNNWEESLTKDYMPHEGVIFEEIPTSGRFASELGKVEQNNIKHNEQHNDRFKG